MTALDDHKSKQTIAPALLFKATELLQKIDQTEFAMLEKIPEMFSWKRYNHPIAGRDPVYRSNIDDEQDEKSMDEYMTSIEEIPIPEDLIALQSKTESENIGDFKESTITQH